MDYYLGAIMLFAGNYAPYGFATCNGATLGLQQNAALFSLISNSYGGDGKTNFMLPNMAGRSLLGWSVPPSTAPLYPLAAKGGLPENTLSLASMPAHIHTATTEPITLTLKASTAAGTASTPDTDNYLAAPKRSATAAVNLYGAAPSAQDTVTLGGLTVTAPTFDSVAIGNTGGNQPFSIMQPYLALQHLICTSGLYPPRQ